MATLTVQNIVPGGLAASYASAAGGGDEFANDGRTFAHVKNGSGSSVTVTIAVELNVDGLALPDRTVAVGAGAEKFIGPFARGTYNDADGNVNLSYSSATSVTVAALRLS